MVVLNAPIQQDKIIEELSKYDKDGVTFTFVEKKGIKLYFNTTMEDHAQAARVAREAIKATAWGAVLYFQASAE